MVRETVIEYELNNVPGGVSVLHWNSAAINAAVSTGISVYLDYCSQLWPATVRGSWDGVVRDMDTATGSLQALSQLATQTQAGNVTVVQDALPQNVSALIKYLTNGIVGNRLVQGRSFIPYISRTYDSSLGQPVNLPATTDLGNSRVVWSRPVYDNTTTPPTLVRAGTEHIPSSVVADGSDWATMGSRRRA